MVIFGDSTTDQLLRQPLIGQSTQVLSVAFSPDGKALLTVGEEYGRIMPVGYQRRDVATTRLPHREP